MQSQRKSARYPAQGKSPFNSAVIRGPTSPHIFSSYSISHSLSLSLSPFLFLSPSPSLPLSSLPISLSPSLILSLSPCLHFSSSVHISLPHILFLFSSLSLSLPLSPPLSIYYTLHQP